MAHPNIEARRAHVQSLLNSDAPLRAEQHREIAQRFGCSTGAIVQDIVVLTRMPSIVVHVHKSRREEIIERDGRVCQYCGATDAASYIIEHIVPAALDGPNEPYNLVMACGSCNTEKGRRVWIPRNLDAITANNPQWKEVVLQMSETPASRPRRPGPVPRLENPVKFSTQITQHHRDLLDAYCNKHSLPAAIAIRRAIQLLCEPEK